MSPASVSVLLPALPLAQTLGGVTDWIDRGVDALTRLAPPGSFFSVGFEVRALLALVLVSFSCGAVGSLVVGSRLAFFSDALAHCAFAGISLGFLVFQGLAAHRDSGAFWEWVTPIMVAYGCAVGLGIVYVRGRTGLANDTVIGVFFAGNLGLYAVLRHHIYSRQFFNLEDFLFGNPILVEAGDLLVLAGLAVVTGVVLAATYNHLLLGGFNRSLALSRRVPVDLSNYAFVVLLALIVNLCLRTIGDLLITALLIVPGATAINLSRNMRQLFWLTLALCLSVSLAGLWISSEVEARYGVRLGISGTIILLHVLLFILSMYLGPWWRQRAA